MKHLMIAALLTLPAAAAHADAYLGRCHMGECLHYDQVSPHIVGTGSAAVPGDLVLVSLRSAVSGDPDADPAGLDWSEPAPAQFFCARTRPAFRTPEGSYQGPDLVTPAGATTLVTTMYLRACRPETDIVADLFAAAVELGYGATPTEMAPDFATLTQG